MLNDKAENEICAREFSLKYVDSGEKGFDRVRRGKNFLYRNKLGKPLKDKYHLRRIKSLVIPPAWENVWICDQPDGHVQVTGMDARGRKQYRYHAQWAQKRNEKKFSQILSFAERLPKIRAQVAKDLDSKGMGLNKVLASVVKVMEQTLIRIGNEEYAEKNKSYGLTTMRHRHVQIKGAKMIFDFKGKSGQVHHIELHDQKLAKIVKRCQELPGQELFSYVDDDGQIKDISSTDVNHYLQNIAGADVTAKDFRTWGGTVQTALFLKDKNPPPSKTEMKKILLQAVQHASSELGNTVAVCRKYYIHPGVFSCFEDGHMKKIYFRSQKNLPRKSKGLSREEVFTKHLLETLA